MDSGDIVIVVPWPIAYTKREDTRQPDDTQKESDGREPFSCLRAGGVNVAARNLLEKLHSVSNENTWATLMAKLLPIDPIPASVAATVTWLASATEVGAEVLFVAPGRQVRPPSTF